MTNSKSVVKEIDVPRYWNWRLAFGDDIHQVKLKMMLYKFKNKISEEIGR